MEKCRKLSRLLSTKIAVFAMVWTVSALLLVFSTMSTYSRLVDEYFGYSPSYPIDTAIEPPTSLPEPYPLPLTSSVLFEQYDDGELYKTAFDPIYQNSLQPQKIHLSPSSDVHPESNVFNVTVSFNLDLRALGPANQNQARYRATVTYGCGNSTEGNVVIEYEDKGENEETEDYTILRFNYTSPETKSFYQSDLIHHVLLKNLKAGGRRYWYQISVEELTGEEMQSYTADQQPLLPDLALGFLSQDRNLRGKRRIHLKENTHEKGQKVAESPKYEFNTPPLYGHPTSIAFVGDLGQTKNSTRTMARILDAARDGWTHNDLKDNPVVTNLFIAGDLSYADGDPNRWDSWLSLAEPLLREVPFASVPGNHEIECDKVTRATFVPYESLFRNPNRIADPLQVPPSEEYVEHHWCTTPSEFLEGHYDYGNAYYSYRQGLVHTIFLNSYTSIQGGSRQRKWLMENALPSVDRTLTPWLVVVFHTPFYTTFLNHMGEINPKLMKESGLREVFQEYHVNLVVSGHDHAYLRTKALTPDGNVAPDNLAPIYWTLGAGGNREGHAKYKNPFWPEQWVAKRDNDEYGFGLFSAMNSTHAHLQWIRDEDNSNHGDDASSMVVRDSVWIENFLYQRGDE